jgi:outer membrane protein assembly factor BamE
MVLGSTSGCVYRANVQQGNFIKTEDLDQLATGMTRKQVMFLLGTPMIADPFHQDRWDYVYYLKIGRDEAAYRRWVSVYFADDVVTEIVRDKQLAHKL